VRASLVISRNARSRDSRFFQRTGTGVLQIPVKAADYEVIHVNRMTVKMAN
jgi:hypothetical protein